MGYLLLVLLAGALFPWRRWRQQRCYLGAAAVVVAAGLAFRLTVLPPNLLTQRALEQAR